MKKFYTIFLFALCCVFIGYSQDVDCILDSGVELVPGPTPDPNFTGFSTYPSETTVQFCYTVDEYNTPGTQNWMHGIVPLFGPGWDLSTLQPIGQPETQFWSGGEWIWVGDVVTGITGELVTSPGWWFDANSGGGALNGDPSDNWGDGNNGPWEFCWEITTKSCPPAFNEASLIVEITNYADSESGSWDVPSALEDCIDDPSYYVQGLQLNCPTCDESGLIVINPTCENVDATGGVVVITPEGVGPWNYIWFNIDTGEIIEQNNSVSLPVTVSGLNAAEYLIQVEDLGFPGGCSAPVYFEILPPEEILVEFNVVNADCPDVNNGSLSISNIMNSNCIDGDLIAEDINLDNVIDNSDFSCPSTSQEVCGCDFVTYFNSCQAENWYGITNYSLGACSVTNSDYEISWTDANGTVSTGQSLDNLYPGEYQVLVECVDNTSPVFGCDFQSVLVVDSPDQISYDFQVSDVSCFVDDNSDGFNDILDGSVTINIQGGTPDYNVGLGIENGGIISNQIGTSFVFNNLGFGDYYFFPTDIFGCELEGDEVFFSISQPEPLILEGAITSDYNGFGVSCNNGQDGFIDVTFSGGTPPYSYQWSNGSVTQNLNSIDPAVYSVIVTDDNGCQIEVDNLIVSEPENIVIVANDLIPVSCSGFSDGSLSINVSGGVSPYTFSWTSNTGFSSNNPNISNIPTGEYTITIIDANDCIQEETFIVDTPNAIELSSNLTQISCFGENDGEISVSVFGGTPPYTWLWSTGDTSEEFIDNLSPGFYDLTVTDSEGCSEELVSVAINEPSVLTATVSIIDVDCFGDNTGVAITNIVGGTPPYIENWSSGANPNNLFAGTYSCVITDNNNCTFTINDININQPIEELQLNADISNVFPCSGGQTGSIIPIGSGGTPPYQYSFTGAASLNSLFAGNYEVSVEDSNGCIVENIFFVDEPNPVSATINVSNVSCFGLEDGQASAIVSGGTPPYVLTWSDPLGNSIDNNNLSFGTYLLSIEDDLGCSYNEFFVIDEPVSSNMAIQVEGDPTCLDPFVVNVFGAIDGMGNWSGSGPGNIIFSNPSGIDTEVTVSEYGIYEIIYTDSCGEETTSYVQMFTLPPNATSTSSIVYCGFETTLQASSPSSEGYWTLLDSPDDTQVNFVDGVTAFNTQIVATNVFNNGEYYGDYLFSFTSCGQEDFVEVTFSKDAPNFGVSTHQDCILDAQIFIENSISSVLSDLGEWQPVGNNADNVIINYQSPDEVSFSVNQFGMYSFRYFICDTFYQHNVGFSCPLDIPNVFTPNGDSNNDLFLAGQLIPSVHSQINFTVYNRSGQIVHSQSNFDYQNNLWDGTTNNFENQELSDGVYYYVLELFNNASQKKESYTGYVHLFRGF